MAGLHPVRQRLRASMRRAGLWPVCVGLTLVGMAAVDAHRARRQCLAAALTKRIPDPEGHRCRHSGADRAARQLAGDARGDRVLIAVAQAPACGPRAAAASASASAMLTTESTPFDGLLAQADSALDRARRSGRNRLDATPGLARNLH